MSARISPLPFPAPAPAQRDPLIGQLIGGRYRIDRIHAQGGMSVVYAATYEAQQREVAVKVIDDAYSSDPKAIDRFIKEARTASSISHGHVVGVSDYGILTNGRPYLVMPLITGQDLATLVAEQGPLPANRVVNLLSGVASALDWMHAQGLVHRDIKSENIMHVCGDDGTESALVLDFGIAARASGDDDDASGTPDFMAPEVLAGEPSDHRADIYSLATVAFELLAGRLPFQGNDLPELLRNRAKHRPRTLAEVTHISFHPALEAAIARGLAKHPSDRPSTASELVLELKRAVARARAPLSAPLSATKSQSNAQAKPQAKPAAPQSGVRRTARRRPVVRLRTLVGFPFSEATASSLPPPPEKAPENLPSIMVDPALGPLAEQARAEHAADPEPSETSGTRRIAELAGAPRAALPAAPPTRPQAAQREPQPIAELRLDPIAPRPPAPIDRLSPLPELELELKPPMRAGYIALRFGLPAAAIIALVAFAMSGGDDAPPSASPASAASDKQPAPAPAPSMAAPPAVVEAPPPPPAPEPEPEIVAPAPPPAPQPKAPSAVLHRAKSEPRAARAPREAKSEPKVERQTSQAAARAPRGDAQALATEGVDAMLRGDFTTALSKLEAATDANPRYAPAFRSKGLLLQRINRPKEAATAFRQYLRLSPNAPDTAKIKARLASLE